MIEQVDMSGKVCMVTGATSGVGQVTARALAAMGAEVIIVARSESKGHATVNAIKAVTGNQNVALMLADPESRRGIQDAVFAARCAGQ